MGYMSIADVYDALPVKDVIRKYLIMIRQSR